MRAPHPWPRTRHAGKKVGDADRDRQTDRQAHRQAGRQTETPLTCLGDEIACRREEGRGGEGSDPQIPFPIHECRHTPLVTVAVFTYMGVHLETSCCCRFVTCVDRLASRLSLSEWDKGEGGSQRRKRRKDRDEATRGRQHDTLQSAGCFQNDAPVLSALPASLPAPIHPPITHRTDDMIR